MGNVQINRDINFEDMQHVIKNNHEYLIINTLSVSEQNCLIFGTLPAEKEEETINRLITTNKYLNIIIYGKNCNDLSVNKKYEQLNNLGFQNIFIYKGGLFEWLMLQDIYGIDLFKTTCKQRDLLKYKPDKILSFNF
jgi:hypothetical protein